MGAVEVQVASPQDQLMNDIPLQLPTSAHILCLGAHCDDIEIGCGATLAGLLQGYPDASVDWVVCCGDEVRRKESEAAARLIGGDRIRLHFLDFRDGHLPWSGGEVKDALRDACSSMQPDIVFTHCAGDLHQDHRLINELTWNLFRNHLVLEYEIPKYDGDLGRPNVYVPLAADDVDAKIRMLMTAFATQAGKHWFTDETFRGLLRLRGIEAGRSVHYAEAFYCRKLCLGTGPKSG